MNTKNNDKQQFKILVVDDNPAIHDDFRKIFAFNYSDNDAMQEEELFLFEKTEKIFDLPKYTIDSAYRGEEALEFVKKSLIDGDPYAIIFVDIRMPTGWDGVETISEIWKIDSKVQTVICTAYSDYSWEDIYKKFGVTDRLLILKKPFDNIEVRQFVTTLVKKWCLAQQVQQQLNFLQKMVDDSTIELRKSISLLRATFEATADGILVTNMEDEIIDYNNKFIQLLEVPKIILQSRKFYNFLNFITNQLDSPENFLTKMQEFYKNESKESFDLLTFKDKKIFECYSKPQKIKDEIIGRVWSFRDITKRRHLEEQLAYQATHDMLTGLYNRTSLLKHVAESIQEAKKNKTQNAILFFDLDRFKLINDSLGHSIGDKLLNAVAVRMKQCIRPNDVLARLGGDEFVLFVDSLSSEHEINRIVNRFFTAITKPFTIDEHVFNITMSAGISIYPKDGSLAEVLFKNADAAMYRAKEMGRNNFQYYTASMNLRNVEKLKLSNELSMAFKNNEFLLYYHPLVDLESKKIIGVEALMRWQHPKRGLLLPVEFIPIAEETGLIIPMGEWVLRTGCKQVKAWHEAGFSDIWLAVNVSAKQFKYGDLVSVIDTVLEEVDFDPKYLYLEITENLLLEDTPELRKTLTQLKQRGVVLAIDDFGVGYSNLNYITKFPIDKLKIDKSFMNNIMVDENNAAIVLAILGLARGLRMSVLAEGVETSEQLKFLQDHKCDEFQGFLVSEPVDAKSCEKILNQANENRRREDDK